MLLPLAVVFLTSLSAPGEFTLANYWEAWQRGNFLLAFVNSTLVALSVTAFQILTSALAGYAPVIIPLRGSQKSYQIRL